MAKLAKQPAEGFNEILLYAIPNGKVKVERIFWERMKTQLFPFWKQLPLMAKLKKD